VNTTLQTVNLDCNEIGAAGATSIVEALKMNKTLQTVDLERNDIRNAPFLKAMIEASHTKVKVTF
jgi:hypothetical protein